MAPVVNSIRGLGSSAENVRAITAVNKGEELNTEGVSSSSYFVLIEGENLPTLGNDDITFNNPSFGVKGEVLSIVSSNNEILIQWKPYSGRPGLYYITSELLGEGNIFIARIQQ